MKRVLLACFVLFSAHPAIAQGPLKPVITIQPRGVTVTEGEVIELTVVATGSAPMQYQWRINRSPIAREVNPTLRITDARLRDNGLYDVVVTNEAGSVTSAPVFATVQSPRMVNLSTRGFVGGGAQALAAGFVIRGRPRMVLIRAVGPTLGSLGVDGTLQNPMFRLYRSEATGPVLLASNDDWRELTGGNAPEAGAFALTLGSRDAALSLRLDDGAYTVEVSASDAAATASLSKTGIVLLEVYDLGDPI